MWRGLTAYPVDLLGMAGRRVELVFGIRAHGIPFTQAACPLRSLSSWKHFDGRKFNVSKEFSDPRRAEETGWGGGTMLCPQAGLYRGRTGTMACHSLCGRNSLRLSRRSMQVARSRSFSG